MTIQELNSYSQNLLKNELLKCCGSTIWVQGMIGQRPYTDIDDIQHKADIAWSKCEKKDVLEAFSHHPQIGDRETIAKKFANTKEWAKDEQKEVQYAEAEIIKGLIKANKFYLDKFGYIFIVFASGKSAEQMLSILESRLNNNPDLEYEIAKKEQHKITKLRLEKLLQ